MASTSSINSSSSGSQAPNPPPRTLSRPNQPPPPPPLPSVPPVPPTRESSIHISAQAAISKNSPKHTQSNVGTEPNTLQDARFLAQYEHLFHPIEELPLPEPFMGKSKSRHNHKEQQKRSVAPT